MSFLPNDIEINELLPRHNPIIIDVRKVINVYDEPTAASALSPIYFPTTHVSTRLYNCCKTFPNIRGMANAHKPDVIFPVVKSFCLLINLTLNKLHNQIFCLLPV